MTMFGVSAGSPAARRRCCHRRLSARPPSIAASLEPVVEQPVASATSGACHSRASMFTQRVSSSAVCGYSSLSIMFLDSDSAISFSACGSIHVVTNVARFMRALPSSISSSWTIWYATSGESVPSGMECRGMRSVSSEKIGATERSSVCPAVAFGCLSATETSSLQSSSTCGRANPRKATPPSTRGSGRPSVFN